MIFLSCSSLMRRIVYAAIFPRLILHTHLKMVIQDGNDYMGAHSDDEKELVQRAPILSISLGQV